MLAFIGRWLLLLILNLLAGGSAVLWALRCDSSRKGLGDFLANWTTIFLGLIVLVQTWLGALGVLNSASTMTVLAAVFAGSALFFTRRSTDVSLPSAWSSDIHAALSGVRQNGAILLIAVLVVWITLALGVASLVSPSTFWDALSYHLPMVATWSQTGSLQPIYLPFAEIANSYFPGNGELLYFWTFAPFNNDLLVRVVSLGVWIVMGLAQYRLSRKMGANREASFFAATLFAGVPIVLAQATEPVLDIASAALFLLALGHLYEFGRSGRLDDLSLLSVAAGLFLGVKYSGPAYAVILIAALLYATSWRREHRSARRWFSCCLVLGAGLVAIGGYWYIRNLVQTGSPLFPLKISLLGCVILPGLVPGTHYNYNRLITQLGQIPLSDLLAATTRGLGFLFPVALAITVLILIVRVLKWRGRLHETRTTDGPLAGRVALLGVLIVAAFGIYSATPYSTMRLSPGAPVSIQGLAVGMRHGIVAFALCAPMIATVVGRRPRVLRAAWLVLVPSMVQSVLSANEQNVLWGQVLTNRQMLAAGLILAAGIAGHLLVRDWQRARRCSSRRLTARVGAVLVLSALGLGGCLYGLVQYREDHRYALYTRVYGDLADGWSWVAHNAREARIAFSGFSLSYPLYGPQLSNEVRYVNISGELDARYDAYEGGAYRAEGSYAEWISNLDEWGADFVAVGNGVVEETWMSAHEARFSLEYGNSEIRIFRVHPIEPD